MITYDTYCIFFVRFRVVYSKQNMAFKSDKNQFFLQLPKTDMVINKIEKVENRANHIGYTFLLQNQKTLEAEFAHTFAVLQKQKDKNNEAFWLYCYYCATLLENFYKAYSQQSKETEYKNLRLKIKNRLLNIKENVASEEAFIESLKESYLKGFRNLMSSPFHISQIRDYVAFSNLCRVYWVFCRLTLTTGLTLAKDLQLIDKLDAVLGTHTDVDKIISVIQAPNGVLNYLSVGFFLMRFMIDAGLLIRHTFFPTDEEKKDKTTALERFKYELYKRHCNFANDLVWATVNFLTNFNHITHIPGPVAGAITAVFLGFDVCMTLYKCQLAKQEYLIKKAQYEQEIEEYNKRLMQLKDVAEIKNAAAHIAMLQAQLKELEIDWRTKQGTFYFVAAAAALLMLGFTASLLFTPPGIIVASFFVCTLATAMYLSAGAYSNFQEKSLRLEQAQLAGKDLEVAFKEYQAARNDFIFTMVKNTVMPALLITTFAICWPAAIALTAMYIGYEIYHAYDQHKSKKEATQLALAAPSEEKITEGSYCCS